MNSFTRAFRATACVSVAAIALTPGLVLAQEEAQTAKVDEQAAGGLANISSEEPVSNEIVVTGTLIRGAAPTGSNLIAVGEEKLESTGATSSNELLASIPQVSNYFNRVPSADLAIAVNQIQISRPNIRNISPNAAASSATLILFDGHRIATAGTKQASIDPDVIPTGAIERVEVVTEGGSATYGADAVAGVINFITRRRFDGVKVEARYGIADDYWQFDANATVGKDWGSGSAYISYTYTKNDALFGRDRDFIRGVDYASLPYRGREVQCDLANIRVGSGATAATFGVQDLTVPGQNRCDPTDDSTTVPAVERHGVFASLFQDLSDTTSIDVKAFYSQRETRAFGTFRGSVGITPANPFYRQIPGRPVGETQTVDFSFAPALGRGTAEDRVFISEWGFSSELRQKLGENWQLRGLFNYSRSNSRFNQQRVSSSRLNTAGMAATTAAAINPYNVAATNPALLADLIDNENAGQAKNDLLDLRAILDGALFSLPGGDVRLALGYEYMHDRLSRREVANVRLGALGGVPFDTYRRSVHSVFGEVNIPVFGADNASPGFHSLVISASGRYDHYSDFGSTINPKVGVTYKPVEWVAFRGNWGTSFTAPTPLDQLGSQVNTLGFFPFAPFIRPEDRAAGVNFFSGTTLAYQGSRPNLQPQTAETWSVGFDVDPPFLSGLHASLSYYNVRFENILSTPTPGDGIFVNFPSAVQTRSPSLGGLDKVTLIPSLIGTALGSEAAVAAALLDPRPVYSIVDFRVGNFGIVKVTGLDFAVNYRREVGFGSVDLSINGNYQLSRTSQVSPGAPVVDLLRGDVARGVDASSVLALQTAVGANIGPVRAQATWNHSSGFDIPPTTGVPVQRRVDAFNTVNLFFKYDVPGESALMKDLSFTLNVNNVFDQDPPVLLRNGQNENGYANGFTLGRMFIFGVSKQF
jgi:iron complex outermembrane recepter protein